MSDQLWQQRGLRRWRAVHRRDLRIWWPGQRRDLHERHAVPVRQLRRRLLLQLRVLRAVPGLRRVGDGRHVFGGYVGTASRISHRVLWIGRLPGELLDSVANGVFVSDDAVLGADLHQRHSHRRVQLQRRQLPARNDPDLLRLRV
jgi:hypothetical protein